VTPYILPASRSFTAVTRDANSVIYTERLRRVDGLRIIPHTHAGENSNHAEHERLADGEQALVPPARRWEWYVAERPWSAVRVDHSAIGDAWTGLVANLIDESRR
jgi:hypothetical protein